MLNYDVDQDAKHAKSIGETPLREAVDKTCL